MCKLRCKMKLRVRYRKITKVYDVSDDVKSTLTVSGIKDEISQLFNDVFTGQIQLSLNNKDVLDGASKLVDDCYMVSGDLIYIVAENVTEKDFHETDKDCQVKGNASINQPSCSEAAGASAENLAVASNSIDRLSAEAQICSSTSSMDCDSTAGSEGNISADADIDEIVDQKIVSQCLSEPVLCRETENGQVPAMLKEMFGFLQPANELEALGVVLHVLMLETGFNVQCEANTQATSSNEVNIPQSWRNTGYLKFTYTYPGCGDTACCLTVLQTGRSAVIHGKVLGSHEATRQLSLTTSAYIRNVQTDCTSCYCELAKLSRIFKDSVASRLVQDLKTVVGQEDITGLLSLAYEIKVRILSYLDVHSLLHASCVHSQLYNASNDQFLWRRLYLRDFGSMKP